MPVENEFNYVLENDESALRFRLECAPDVVRQWILQGYLADGVRVRAIEDLDTGVIERVLSFKVRVRGEMVEVEKAIDVEDFGKLWRKRNETVKKYRYKFEEGDVHWDVDFFGPRKACYFVKAEAEAEVDASVKEAPEISERLADSLVYVAGKEKGFSSRRLSDEKYARKLMKEVRARVEETRAPGMAA